MSIRGYSCEGAGYGDRDLGDVTGQTQACEICRKGYLPVIAACVLPSPNQAAILFRKRIRLWCRGKSTNDSNAFVSVHEAPDARV
jgi:hypothetical protein